MKNIPIHPLFEGSTVVAISPCPRLEGVEARLQESSEAFERSREVAKKSKMEYEKVKKRR